MVPPPPDADRFAAQIEASEREDPLFRDFYLEVDEEASSVAALRRRRRRVSNQGGGALKTISLVEEDGVLYWRDGIPARVPSRRRGSRRRGESVAPSGELVLTREFPVLAPNRVVAALGALDCRLNRALASTLRSRLRQLRQKPDGDFELELVDAVGPFAGRTLLFVHGTFSNAQNFLEELTEHSPRGRQLLARALSGTRAYERVLFFEQPTLSVSPVLNALELARAFAGASGPLDVVAHSRGGLVVRWWLEAFGDSLRLAPGAGVRAVLAGSPLHGTSLAAPDKLQHALSLISNLGTFAEITLRLTGLANPFLWVAGKLVEIVVSVTGALARTPLLDALTALVPGLAGQSAVENNLELERLRRGPAAVAPEYHAIVSNFETADPGWRFWRNFRKDRAGDLAADAVFPGENDLVVDTASMTDLGVPGLDFGPRVCDFGTTDRVWHCNYFRQKRAIDAIATAFKLALD